MKIIQKAIKAGDQYYIKHLNIINNFIPQKMKDKEMEVLAAFMEIEGELVSDYRFNPVVRKKVMEKLNLSPSGLSGYLKSLVEKDILNKSTYGGIITINEFLWPEPDVQGYQFKLSK